jgi:ATPase family AAA domain-containing protein 1
MTHWDGLVSANAAGKPQRICILGATNRMRDIDEAILRRMPKKFAVPLPGARQRRNIFDLVLKDTKKDPIHFDMDFLVHVSDGLSGSDIKEACRDAAMLPMREYIKAHVARNGSKRIGSLENIRGVRTDDFFRDPGDKQPSTTAVKPSKIAVADIVADDEDERVWTDASSEPDDHVTPIGTHQT